MNICMIPVRKGSQRLPKKNYLKIGKHTILEIAILKAIASKAFKAIVINTDDPSLEKIASRMGVDFYLRDKRFASSEATSDQVVLDFFNHYSGDRVFWLNTASPLQTLTDVKNFVDFARKKSWKSGVSINTNLAHILYKSNPLNFLWKNGFARTQDLEPVQILNYAMMGWHRSMIDKLKVGQLFDNNTDFVCSSKWSSFLLKNEKDMELIKILSKVAPDQGFKFK